MKKAVIITLIVLISVSIIGFAFIQKSSKTSNSTSEININPSSKITPESSTIIELTKNGFEPKEINIKPGSQIIWINKSGQLATVDSNPHPIHTDNPELNLGEIKDGGSVSFTFTKIGEFKYHNHYNPDEGGTITVK